MQREIESCGGIAIIQARPIALLGSIGLFSRPQITHVYLHGTLEFSAEQDEVRLFRVQRQRAAWLLQDRSTLASIQVLELSATDVGDRECPQLSQLPALRVLKLAGTRITKSGLQEFANNESIRRLDISFTEIGDESVSTLASMPDLQEVSVAGCGMSEQGLSRLIRANPRIVVHRHR